MLKSLLIRKAVFAGLLLGCLAGAALAGGPVFWEVSRQDDILKGDARGVSIAESGAITLAPAYTLVYDTREAYIWSSVADAQGNIYLGTGQEGRVFKVEPSGAGRQIFDAPELNVTALAVDAAGNVYAGTTPDGKIYKITPAGQSSVFYDPPDKYIWALVYDAAAQALYAGTGDKGVIYRIDAAGKATVLADTNETNIVSLALDRSGGLLAGTDPSGLVLRVAADGKTFALFDSPMQEVRSLSLAADGSLFAIGVNQQASPAQSATAGVSSSTSLSREGVITISTEDEGTVQAVDMSALSAGSARGRSRAEGARSALFRILPDGGSDVLWTTNDATGFSLRALPDGRVLVGTNDKGRIYAIGPDRSDTLLIQSPEDQTSGLLAIGENLYATSSNLGRLYRIGREPVTEGTYVSTVHDTKFAGQWGIINWRGSGNVELQTRSGNTESPDATWSDWSAVYRSAGGEQINSPRARFIQWRAVLRRGAPGAGAAQLQSVVVAYLPRNQAPEVTSVSVLPPGVALAELPQAIDPSIQSSGLDPQLFGQAMNVPPRRFYQKGSRTLTWQASDANGDTLVYQIFYRTASNNGWHLLAGDVSQNYYTMDANRLPDGAYFFKVQASDSPSNPADRALTSEQVTDAIEIDNTPPQVQVSGPQVSGQTVEIVFTAQDSTSRVVRGEYSVNGGPWQLVFPEDGVADAARETFRVRAQFSGAGEHLIAFRCADSSQNVGTSKVTVTVR